jgi:spore coat protein F
MMSISNVMESENKLSLNQEYRKHLAWHETLELHELVAFQASQLVSFKKKFPSLQDPVLRTLYAEAISALTQHIQELLQYYPHAPTMERNGEIVELPGAESGQLLGFAKTAIRNYALAITETATPQLRETFQRHLFNAIGLHARVFGFMYERGYYPAYDLQQLLNNDVRNARIALML